MPRKKSVLLALAALVALASTAHTQQPDPWAGRIHRPSTEPELIAVFAHAYRTMDLDLYTTLFAEESRHGVGFRFILYEPTPEGETAWGYDEERRVHRRMFRPASIGTSEKPLAPSLWVRSIAVELVQVAPFVERFDLYRSEHNPMGELDRKRWRATSALYSTAVTWHTQGGAVMRIAGYARFVVIEDLLVLAGAPDKLLIYRWEDLGPGAGELSRLQP